MKLQSLKIIKRILRERCFKLCFHDLIFIWKGRAGGKKSILSDFSRIRKNNLSEIIDTTPTKIESDSALQM
jgi:hypothetical protein